MIPTFVIGLREGVEASLIVGIVAAFLRQEGRSDALRWMWTGVALAAAICAAGGIALEIVSENLPQKEQEALETVVALIAVVAVTFMIVWMRRNARSIKGALEGHAKEALAAGSVLALVGMAFFAVIREGFETSVFLLAAFDSSTSPAAAGAGAVLGVLARGPDRVGDLSRRCPHQPRAVLPHHRRRPRPGGRGPRRLRGPHRARGGLAQQHAGPRRRPPLARRARQRPLLAADRHPRLPAGARGRRGARLLPVCDPDVAVRPVADSGPRRPEAREPVAAGRPA